MLKDHWGEIKDPVHGYVYITQIEKALIDSYPIQRMRRLRQLAGSEYVYPSANHTRFEHSLGTMFLAGKTMENPNISRGTSEDEREMVRIAGLLHDVGHGPFSHVFEHLLDKQDKTHEDMTAWVITHSELREILRENGLDDKAISELATGQSRKSSKNYLAQVISSAVDVDKMDFIVRDTYHTGAEYGYVDVFRLIHALDVLNDDLAVDLGALSALESLIIARMESFRSIYFHRVGRAAQIMLATAMEKADSELGLTRFETPENYLEMDDYTVWTMLKRCKSSAEIIRKLERRKLLKCAFERTFYERDPMISNVFSQESYRKQLQDKIAEKAGVASESVTIDVPTVPSVPYHHSVLLEPMEIPAFYRTPDGQKTQQDLSEISKVFNALRGFINILRVYTNEENRKEVAHATLKILGETPTAAGISY